MEIISEQVKKFIGNKEILKGINIDVKNKEFLGIIGPNGSGKSTFLKCIYRILKPSEGKILFNGKNIDELSFRQTALDLAVVAQHNFYNFDFKVLDVVLMGRSPHKKILERDNEIDYKIARNALEKVGLKDFVERNFTTLSGGEQQRVILMDIVKSLNLTVIAAIHDLNIASMYCDRLIAFQNGKIVGEGTPKDLLNESFIKNLYEVDTKVDNLENGKINIRYIPQHFK